MKTRQLTLNSLVMTLFLTSSLSAIKAEEHNEYKGHADEGKAIHEEHEGHEDHESGDTSEHIGHPKENDTSHAEHAESDMNLSMEIQEEFGIKVLKAGPGKLQLYVDLPGEISYNEDHLAHISTIVSGVVKDVYVKLGDHVESGALLATLKSRDLAEMKSEYISIVERKKLAQQNFDREEKMWEKKISTERDYLEAKNELAMESIKLNSSRQKLLAIGVEKIEQLTKQDESQLSLYHIYAPFSGTITEKHLSIGEYLSENSSPFTLSNLNTVWVNLSIYQKNVPFITVDQDVRVYAEHGGTSSMGKVFFISSVIDESTRTALARVQLDNENGKWRPGSFIKATAAIEQAHASIVIPRTALQTINGQTVVFVKGEQGFKQRSVTLGLSNQNDVEVLKGLWPGDIYASEGVLTLKSQMGKSSLSDGHNH